MRYQTFGTLVAVCAHYQGLLQMVTNEYSIDWMALVLDAISTHHGNAGLTISLDWKYDKIHAEMKGLPLHGIDPLDL